MYAKHGSSVLLVDISEQGGQRVKKDITSTGGKCEFVSANVALRRDWEKILDNAKQNFGGINILVNSVLFGIFALT